MPGNNLKNALAKKYGEGPATLPLTDLRTGDLFGPGVKNEVIATPHVNEEGKAVMKQPPKPIQQVTGGASMSGPAPRYSVHAPLEEARVAVAALPKPKEKKKTPEELLAEADRMIADMKAGQAASTAYVGGVPRMPVPAAPVTSGGRYEVQAIPATVMQAEAVKTRPIAQAKETSGKGMMASQAPKPAPSMRHELTNEELGPFMSGVRDRVVPYIPKASPETQRKNQQRMAELQVLGNKADMWALPKLARFEGHLPEFVQDEIALTPVSRGRIPLTGKVEKAGK